MTKRLTDADVLALIEREIARLGSASKAARAWGVWPSYVSQVRRSGKLGTTIPKALGLRHIPGHYVRET